MAEIKCTGTMIAMDEMYTNPMGYCVIDEHGISILQGVSESHECYKQANTESQKKFEALLRHCLEQTR